jgi:shikimate kinase
MTRDFGKAQLVARQGLALVGVRGTGKSTVGQLVAARLRRPFFDADRELERRAGQSVSSILRTQGEAVFRDWEERTLVEMVEGSPSAVIATGGGVVLRESNRRILRAFGHVVWLRAAPSELARRIECDPLGLAARPPLTAAGTIGEIERVIEVRLPLYQQIADVVIETENKSPEWVAAAILETWPQ